MFSLIRFVFCMAIGCAILAILIEQSASLLKILAFSAGGACIAVSYYYVRSLYGFVTLLHAMDVAERGKKTHSG